MHKIGQFSIARGNQIIKKLFSMTPRPPMPLPQPPTILILFSNLTPSFLPLLVGNFFGQSFFGWFGGWGVRRLGGSRGGGGEEVKERWTPFFRRQGRSSRRIVR